ncbi:MAG: major facilitator superfamily 1 [Phenylobacterium sp.]|nr:major facilitator superfamily 1 [Phenylobacterium sp.]
MAEIAIAASRPRAPTLGAGVVVLLAVAVFINYVDRGNLATAGPLIKDELGLTATQFGLLVSVFFWTYTPAQILAGWMAEKINPYRTLALGLALWAAATALTGFATGFAMLIALRLLLGLGESVAFPCSSKVLAQNLPPHRLGIANGLIAVGLSLGPAFGTFTGGLLMAQLGWRPVFLLFGLGSLVWLWPWLVATRHLSTADDRPKLDAAPPFRAILARREAWGAGLGHFASNYALYFVISWLPIYLVKTRGFSVSQMAELGGLIYLVYAASSVATGWLTDRWMAAGASANRVRKTVIIASHLLSASAMAGCALGDTRIAVASLFAAGVAFGLNSLNVYAIAQTLAGPRAAGKWVGFQNCVGNLAGIVAPIVTGMVVDRTGEFTWAFAVAGAVSLLGVAGWGLMIRKVAPIDWKAA